MSGPPPPKSREHAVCRVEDLKARGAVAADVGPVRVAVFWLDGEPRALNETCPHRGGPLHLGEVRNGVVRCPWHLWQFDLATGCSPANPNSRVAVYPARVEGGSVLVRAPAPAESNGPPRRAPGMPALPVGEQEPT